MLVTLAKSYSSYLILENRISLFRYFYSNCDDDCFHQHYLSESSSPSPTDSNYLQNQGSNLAATIEIEPKEQPQPPYIKRILVVDDDPDLTLTL